MERIFPLGPPLPRQDGLGPLLKFLIDIDVYDGEKVCEIEGRKVLRIWLKYHNTIEIPYKSYSECNSYVERHYLKLIPALYRGIEILKEYKFFVVGHPYTTILPHVASGMRQLLEQSSDKDEFPFSPLMIPLRRAEKDLSGWYIIGVMPGPDNVLSVCYTGPYAGHYILAFFDPDVDSDIDAFWRHVAEGALRIYKPWKG